MNNVLDEPAFAQRAAEVLAFIAQQRHQTDLASATRDAADRFVHDESHPQLQRLAEVLVYARRQALLQDGLDDDRERLHHGHLNHDEHTLLGHHYETLRHQACQYNHLLRGFIEACGHHVSREELLTWLTSASQGRKDWAYSEITGASSEVALHAALQGLPELRGLRYAEVEEDLIGYDFIAQWQGQILTIDAKTGVYRPLVERKHGHRHLEVSVPREVVKDFRITRHGLDLLRHEVRQVLHGAQAVDAQEPHHFFRPAPVLGKNET